MRCSRASRGAGRPARAKERRLTARPESWSPPAEPRGRLRRARRRRPGDRLLRGAWATLHHGFYRHHQIVDTPIYQRYGDAIADGQVPYRDFGLEYPPGALPVFVIPSVLTPGTNGKDYRTGCAL